MKWKCCCYKHPVATFTLAVILWTPHLILHPASISIAADVCLLLSVVFLWLMRSSAHVCHREVFLYTFSINCCGPAVCLVFLSPPSLCSSYHLFLQHSHFFHAAVIWYEHGLPHLSQNRTEGHPLFCFWGSALLWTSTWPMCPKLIIMFLENKSKNGNWIGQGCGKQRYNNALCSVCVWISVWVLVCLN